MTDDSKSGDINNPDNRGRIQAQGGGTEKSESWAQPKPPTESKMLKMCDDLETQLTNREKMERAQPLAKLRQFIRSAAQRGGVAAPCWRSWTKPGSKDIRVDLEVIKGQACIPDFQ